MEIVVDLVTARIVARDPEDLKRFGVRVLPGQVGDAEGTVALGALAAALSIHGAGWVDKAGVVFVPADAVRRLASEAAVAAGGALGPEWEQGFTAMLEYAATKGWIGDDGAIQAHIEWEPA